MTVTSGQASTQPVGRNVQRGAQEAERGRRIGAAWAADSAEYVELKRLAAVAAHLRFDDKQVGYRVVRAILGERMLSGPEIATFRESIGIGNDDDVRAESGDYWQGFVDSALDVFENVEF